MLASVPSVKFEKVRDSRNDPMNVGGNRPCRIFSNHDYGTLADGWHRGCATCPTTRSRPCSAHRDAPCCSGASSSSRADSGKSCSAPSSLRRFDQHLGGGWLGLAVFSVAFGLGHFIQGWDTVVVTGALGVLWGALYLTRGSAVAAMVSHTGFNLTQIALALAGAQT